MRHPASRRSIRKSATPALIPASVSATAIPQSDPTHPDHDPASQNRPAPGVPPDGDYNQGGVRKEGIEYQRDLGSEQDA